MSTRDRWRLARLAVPVVLLLVGVAVVDEWSDDFKVFAGEWRDAKGLPLSDGSEGRGFQLKATRERDSSHCNGAEWVSLLVAWPPGSTYEGGRPSVYEVVPGVRQYVRYPAYGFIGELAGRFLEHAELPPGAHSTGISRLGWTIWIGFDAASYIYLVGPDRIERWPRVVEVGGCE